MNAILDYDHYKSEMKKAMADKLFFINQCEFDILVDFGCADGALIQHLAWSMPDKLFIGYDNNINMIQLAQQNKPSNLWLFDNFKQIELFLHNIPNKKKAVLCSSIIHEIYSYLNQSNIGLFWQQIFSGIFDTIIIRDMAIEQQLFSSYAKNDDIKKINNSPYKHLAQDFESIWGNLQEKNNMIHFLMKYRYEKNWSREVYENYFPLTSEKLKSIINQQNYHIDFWNHFTLPFQKQVIQQDFGINLDEKTHIKMILKQ